MAIETLGAALRQINRLFAGGVIAGLSDAQLLERFLAQGDAGAFEALVGRHGPMVLSVCRAILRDPHDAEDAFQATFLVLVQNGGAIRGRDALAGWLHRVAHRVANQANVAAARRRRLERQVGEMAVATSTSGPAASDEWLPALHEEIARLPEKYRLAVVHCDLEGMTQAQAAGQLHWSRRTLQNRLAEGRARLRSRLARRGLAPDGAALGAVLLREAQAAVPVAWREATVRAAVAVVNPTITVGAVSLAAQQLAQEVYKIMLLKKLTSASAALLAAGLIGWGASAALIALGQESPQGASAPAVSTARPTAETAVPRPKPGSADTAGTFPARGRVLDPDGKPVAGAVIFIRPNTRLGGNPGDSAPKGQKGRVAASDGDGRFQFELDKASSDWSWGDLPAWHHAKIAAVAPGLALAWVEAGSLLKGDEATLRLVRDDVPIHGRVVNPQGRPVAGATVRLIQIGTVKDGADLDAMLTSGELENGRTEAWYGAYYEAIWPGGNNTWTTDADGRFEIKGIGHDRIAALEIHGSNLVKSTLYAMARPAKNQPKPRPHPTSRDRVMMLYGSPPREWLVGATFEHIVDSTKPITGVVRSKATGQPLEGIRVYGREAATWTWVVARTDAQGRFRLVGLPKGESYQVSANDGYGAVAPFLGAEIMVSDTEGLKPIETALELPRGVALIGRLFDPATGRPVRIGQVEYHKLPTNRNEGQGTEALKSPNDPTFRLTIPPGAGMICVRAQGKDLPYTRARLRKADKGKGVGGQGDDETFAILLNGYHACKFFDIPADAESFAVDLELTRGSTRKGRVIDPEGKPVTGAQCFGLSATWGEMKTLADDTFEACGLEPGHPRQLIFAHKGRRLIGSVIIKGEDGDREEPLVLRLEPPGSIKGRLVDEDGLPMAGATLRLLTLDLDGTSLPPGRDAMWPDSEVVITGADGRFQIDGLKPGIKCNGLVKIKGPSNVEGDAGEALRGIVIRKAGEVRDLGDIKVKVVRPQ